MLKASNSPPVRSRNVQFPSVQHLELPRSGWLKTFINNNCLEFLPQKHFRACTFYIFTWVKKLNQYFYFYQSHTSTFAPTLVKTECTFKLCQKSLLCIIPHILRLTTVQKKIMQMTICCSVGSSSLCRTWTELHSSAPAWSSVSIFMPTGWHMCEVNEQWGFFVCVCVCFGCKEKIRCIHACWLAPIRVWSGLDVASAYLSCVCKVVALQLDHISRTSSCAGPSALSEGIGLDGADWTPEASLQVHWCLI